MNMFCMPEHTYSRCTRSSLYININSPQTGLIKNPPCGPDTLLPVPGPDDQISGPVHHQTSTFTDIHIFMFS